MATKESKEAVTAAPKLKPAIEELSKKITSGLELNRGEGLITETRNNFHENLPEGITPEIEQTVSDYRSNFVAASAHAVGELAIDGLSKNRKIDEVSGELAMGKDAVRHSVARSREYSFGSGADRKTIEKHGVITSEIDIKGGRNSGQLKVAKTIIGEIAAEKLKK